MDVFCARCDLESKCPAEQRQLVKMIVDTVILESSNSGAPTPDEILTDYPVEDIATAEEVAACVINQLEGKCEGVK